jgi:hypothetical protein
MRAWTLYEQIEHDQPGTSCRIHTFPNREDLEAMGEDIKKAKTQADVVILSMHWGIHFVPAVIADYQRQVGHVAIDSGADLILGHHAHILKGIEVYKGKVILYSLSNFALESPFAFAQGSLNSSAQKEIQSLYWKPGPESPMHPDATKTLVTKCIISNKGIKTVSILPTIIDKESQPEVLTSKDERFGEIVRYMEKITADQGLDTDYTVRGEEVVLV